MTQPTGSPIPTTDPAAVPPHDILAKIAGTEMGKALVERAFFQCLAERYAAELTELRAAPAAEPS